MVVDCTVMSCIIRIAHNNVVKPVAVHCLRYTCAICIARLLNRTAVVLL